jgi:hypothetical protein
MAAGFASSQRSQHGIVKKMALMSRGGEFIFGEGAHRFLLFVETAKKRVR